MDSSDVTSNGRALAIAVAAVVALVVLSGGAAVLLGASLFTIVADEVVTAVGDVDLDELATRCDEGDLAACDELYALSPLGSDEEEFGSTCGGTSPTQQFGTCAEGGDVDAGEVASADEPTLAALRDACAAGDLVACDELWLLAPVGSDDEEFGATCGGTQDPRDGPCAGVDDLRAACADGNLEACDQLWFASPDGSDDKEFGSTCGGRRVPTFGGCSG